MIRDASTIPPDRPMREQYEYWGGREEREERRGIGRGRGRGRGRVVHTTSFKEAKRKQQSRCLWISEILMSIDIIYRMSFDVHEIFETKNGDR